MAGLLPKIKKNIERGNKEEVIKLLTLAREKAPSYEFLKARVSELAEDYVKRVDAAIIQAKNNNLKGAWTEVTYAFGEMEWLQKYLKELLEKAKEYGIYQ
jgi:hypothetical protein